MHGQQNIKFLPLVSR